MAQKILFKRGLKANLPTLQVGEPAFCTDTGEFFVGSSNGNVLVTGVGVEGPQGEQGSQGESGADGQNGIDGKSTYQLWLDAGNTGTLQNFLDSLKGPKGDTGEAGTGEGGSVPSNVILFEDWTSGETVTIDGATPTDTTAPNDVTNLTYMNVTQTGLRLTWTAYSSSDVASYRIFEGATQIGSATVNQLDITGLTAGTTHTYTVKAVDNAGNVSAGVSVTVTTSAPTQTNTAPSITSSYSTTTVNDSTSVSIPYTVTDADGGTITATLTKDGTPTTATITTGANTWNVGTLSVGSHTLTIQVADSAGLTSNTLTFNLTVTVTETTPTGGYVNDASLLLYKDAPVNNTTVANPDNYFMTNEPFTFEMTVKPVVSGSNAASNLLSRFVLGGTENKYNIEFTWDNKFKATFYGSNKVVTSAAYTDLTKSYHIALVRNATHLTLYVDNVQVSQVTMDNTISTPVSTLPMTVGQSGKAPVFKNMAYYNRALTTAELTQNYNALK